MIVAAYRRRSQRRQRPGCCAATTTPSAEHRRPHVQRMPRPAIRPGRRHLAALLEVPGRPDAERLAGAPTASADGPGDSTSAAPAQRGERGIRSRARRAGAPGRATTAHAIARARGAARTRSITSSTVISSMHGAATAALPLVETLTQVAARDTDDVGRHPRTVALGLRRTEERHERRADGGGDVQRTGVAATPPARAACASANRSRDRRRRRRRRRRRATRRPPLGERLLAAAPRARRTAARALAKRAAKAPNRSGGHRLLGHAAPGLSDRERAPARATVARGEDGAVTADGDVASGNATSAAPRRPAPASSARFLR